MVLHARQTPPIWSPFFNLFDDLSHEKNHRRIPDRRLPGWYFYISWWAPPQWNVCWWTSPHLNRKLFKRILHQLVIYYSYLHQLNAIYKPHNGAPVMICSQDCWLARVLLRFDRHFGGAAPLFAHLGAAGRGSEPSVPSVGFGRGWRSQWPGQFLSWWDFLNGFSSSFIGQKGVLSHQKCNEAVDITNCFAFFSVHFFKVI